MSTQPTTNNQESTNNIPNRNTSLRKLFAVLHITRPLNVAITGLSILLAAALVRPSAGQTFELTSPIAFAILSGMLIAAGANVINDLCDIDIDKINRPQRVLPSGKLSTSSALAVTIFLFVCGNFFSIFINLAAVTVAAATSILVIVYSRWLKRQPVTGNLAVSAATALAFIYGALAAQIGLSARPVASVEMLGASLMENRMNIRSWTGDWRAGIFPAVFSFLFHFGREVIKDLEDQIGDKAVRARTLPLAYGLTIAQSTATAAFGLLIAVTWLPYCFGLYGSVYLWIVVLGVDSVLLFAIYWLWKCPQPNHMRKASAILKADMLVGLAAIYWGQ
jgi:geranylgeranylglycerol-phosphate geranylgeranyltransferase